MCAKSIAVAVWHGEPKERECGRVGWCPVSLEEALRQTKAAEMYTHSVCLHMSLTALAAGKEVLSYNYVETYKN